MMNAVGVGMDKRKNADDNGAVGRGERGGLKERCGYQVSAVLLLEGKQSRSGRNQVAPMVQLPLLSWRP